MMRGECLTRPQLCFVNHPLVTVTRMLHPIEQILAFDRQQPLDRISTCGNVSFEPIGDQIDRLADFEFVMCHATLAGNRRRNNRRPDVLYQIACGFSARTFTAPEQSRLFGIQPLDRISFSPNTNSPLDAGRSSFGLGASRRRTPAPYARRPTTKQAPIDRDIGESAGKCQGALQ